MHCEELMDFGLLSNKSQFKSKNYQVIKVYSLRLKLKTNKFQCYPI